MKRTFTFKLSIMLGTYAKRPSGWRRAFSRERCSDPNFKLADGKALFGTLKSQIIEIKGNINLKKL